MENSSSNNQNTNQAIADINEQLEKMSHKNHTVKQPQRSWLYLLFSIITFLCFSNFLGSIFNSFTFQRTPSYSQAPSSYSILYSLCFLISLGISIILLYISRSKLAFRPGQFSKRPPIKRIFLSAFVVLLCYFLMRLLVNLAASETLYFASQIPFEVLNMFFTATALPTFPLSQLVIILVFNLVSIGVQAFMAYLCISYAQIFGNYIFKVATLPWGGFIFGILYAITIFFRAGHTPAFALFILLKGIIAGVVYLLCKQNPYYSTLFIYILLLM